MSRAYFIPKEGFEATPNILPCRDPITSAGIDLFCPEEILIKPHERLLIPTGFEILLPEGHFAQVVDTSAFPLKYGGHVLGGIIDPDYQGEIFVNVLNTTSKDLVIPKGLKIAQMLVHKLQPCTSVIMTGMVRGTFSIQTLRGRRGYGVADTDSLTGNCAQETNLGVESTNGPACPVEPEQRPRQPSRERTRTVTTRTSAAAAAAAATAAAAAAAPSVTTPMPAAGSIHQKRGLRSYKESQE